MKAALGSGSDSGVWCGCILTDKSFYSEEGKHQQDQVCNSTMLLFIATRHWSQYSILDFFFLKKYCGGFFVLFYVDKEFPCSRKRKKKASYVLLTLVNCHGWWKSSGFLLVCARILRPSTKSPKWRMTCCSICNKHRCHKAILSWNFLSEPVPLPNDQESWWLSGIQRPSVKCN